MGLEGSDVKFVALGDVIRPETETQISRKNMTTQGKN